MAFKNIAITAIGTEVGKTYVACGLLRALKARAIPAQAIKPVMSGFDEKRLEDSDAGRLLAAMGRDVTIDNIALICPYRFAPPISPNQAARLESVDMTLQNLIDFAKPHIDDVDVFTVLEGAGGALSPLTDDGLNLDLITALDLPVLLVGANYLGAISHSLSALEACEKRHIDVAGVIISQPSPDHQTPNPLCEELQRWTQVPIYDLGYGQAFEDAPWSSELLSKLTR